MKIEFRMETIGYMLFHYKKHSITFEGCIDDLRKKFPGATIVSVPDEVLQKFRDNERHFRVYPN